MSLILLVEKLALVGATIHSMVPGSAPAPGTILIDRDRIEAVGADIDVPADARVIDATGLHVLPGLVDGMGFLDADHDRLYVSCGITMLRDAGNDLTQIQAERDILARDRNPGPALWIAGAVLDGNPPSTTAAIVAQTREEVVDKLSRLLDMSQGRIDYFAYQPGLPREAWQAAIQFAHKQQNPRQVWGSLPQGVTLDEALAAGQDGFFHLGPFLPAGKSWHEVTQADLEPVVEKLVAAKAAVTPTLAISAQSLIAPKADSPPQYKYLGPLSVALWAAELETRKRVYEKRGDLLKQGAAAFERQSWFVKRLHDAGVALVPGSSSGQPWMFPGDALLDELSLWVRAGIPRDQVLELATRGACERLGIKERGVIKPGYVADLVLTKGDPTTDLALLHRPAWVILRGRALPATELAALRDDLAARQKRLHELAFKDAPALAEPDLPIGEVLLAGKVENRVLGQRVSVETYGVVRASDGALVYCGRMLTFGTATTADTEVEIRQSIRESTLDAFEMKVKSGPRLVELKGTRVANSLNIERRLDGVFVNKVPVRERVAFLDVKSVTTYLILGQHCKPGEFRALWLEDFEPVSGEWSLRVDPKDGTHLLKRPWEMVLKFDAEGAPELCQRTEGRGAMVTTSLRSRAGAGGLAVPRKENPAPAKPR